MLSCDPLKRLDSRLRRRVAVASLTAGIAAGLTATAPTTADASPKRRGFQSEFLVGASACIPGRAQCSADDPAATGETNPHLGLGVTLGFRPIRPLMIGAAYNLGFFNPEYAGVDSDLYRGAHQHAVFAVVRAILPIWRLDLGLELGPGWSRQTFRGAAGAPFARVSSQGPALKFGPVADIFLTRRFFLGAKVDFIFNFHREVCLADGDGMRTCARAQASDQAAVHQVIAGVHIGSVF